MGYSRTLNPDRLPTGEHLDGMLAGIGCSVAVKPLRHANVEDALLGAVAAGMEEDDYRTLGLAMQWIGEHARLINVDRLSRVVPALDSARIRAAWAGVARWQSSDRRWARLARLPDSANLLRSGQDFQLRRRGSDPRFAAGGLLAPAGVLRERPGDVMPLAELVRWHRGCYHRVLLGPTYRADMWAAAELDADLGPSDLARLAYGSFATAWQVRRDRALLALDAAR